MFLLRKFRFKTLGIIIVLVLVPVAVVTLMLTANNYGNDTGKVVKMQLKEETDTGSTTSVSVSEITLPPWPKLINSSLVIEHQLQRQWHLREACKRLGLSDETPNFKTADMYVSDTFKYVYCVVNKVACTSWKRVLLMASGEMTVDKPEKLSMTYVHNWRNTDRYFSRIRTFSLEQVKERLKTHFKFMFVRHPLERLVSTYRDKFTKRAYYYPQRFGRKIIGTVRGANASQQSLKRGHDVTFPEMVQYLLDPQTTRIHDQLLSDNHWRPTHLLCHPCYVHYDFIGHYETLYEDAQAVLQALGIDNRARFPDTDPDNRWKKKTAEVSANLLAQISTEQLHRVKELYAYDFELFGYDQDLL